MTVRKIMHLVFWPMIMTSSALLVIVEPFFHGPVFSNWSPHNLILRWSGISNTQSKCSALVYKVLQVLVCVCVCEWEGERDERGHPATFYHSAVLRSLSHTSLSPPLSFLLTHAHYTSNHAFKPSSWILIGYKSGQWQMRARVCVFTFKNWHATLVTDTFN